MMSDPERTRSSMFNRLRSGDEQAWADFDRTYRPWLTRLADSRGLGEQAADELASEVIVVLYRKMPNWKYDRSKGGLRAYLGTCIRNAASSYKRTNSRNGNVDSQLVELVADDVGFESLLDVLVRASEQSRRQANLKSAISLARSQANDMQWQAWRLTEYQGVSVDEVAERLKTSPNNIYTLKHRFSTLIKDITRRLDDESA